MKSRAFILSFLALFAIASFAEEASTQESKNIAQSTTKDIEVALLAEEPKQVNQGGGGGRGGCSHGQFRYCCGGYGRAGCNRYCCRAENGAKEVELTNVAQGNNVAEMSSEEPKQVNQGGDGSGCGGRYRYCCSGYYGGYCRRWCCRSTTEVQPKNNNGKNIDQDHKESKGNQAKVETKN